jgi:hypothetical protein
MGLSIQVIPLIPKRVSQEIMLTVGMKVKLSVMQRILGKKSKRGEVQA